ncbi:MAG TPA: PD-(D/E)XK nuclease family protein, partial [Actinoplanes sp.]|nr:PD-(D/E)XK nuclease family protein [Actinoplanes sp.]
DEVRASCLAGAGVVDRWTPQPAGDAGNPSAAVVARAEWPGDPLGARRPVLSAAADLIRRLLDAAQTPAPTADAVDGGVDEVVARWRREGDLLLAERAERAHRDGPVEVALPGHLSVSQLVVLRRDPIALARSLRRPMPSRPTPYARRGTAFHAWLEQRYGAVRLLDVDELPGAADEGAVDAELAVLQEAFLAGEWADRTPVDVEVPFATTIGGVTIRGRMDAVFADPDGGFDVIDWKTGRRPDAADEGPAAVQLAAYRMAWASLAGVPPQRVRAGFYYVRDQVTVRPAELPDADALTALVTGLGVAEV